MRIFDLFRRHEPQPTDEALEAQAHVTDELRPRAEAVARERKRLMRENHFAPRIQAIYRGEA